MTKIQKCGSHPNHVTVSVRGYDLDIDTVGTSGESRVPVEFLPVILLRTSSCREF